MFLLTFKAGTEMLNKNTTQDWHFIRMEKTSPYIFSSKVFFQISYFRKSCRQADGGRDER